jgi:hypothetical protein
VVVAEAGEVVVEGVGVEDAADVVEAGGDVVGLSDHVGGDCAFWKLGGGLMGSVGFFLVRL